MIDIVSYVLDPTGVRNAAIACLWVSALLVGVMAFAATSDAGIRSPLAFLRATHRVFMVMFAISLAYLAAWLWDTPDRTPAGPALLLDMSMMLVVIVSAVRHSMAPGPISNTWRGVLHAIRDKMNSIFYEAGYRQRH